MKTAKVNRSVATVQPFPYQEPVVRNIVKALRSTGRALFVMATGTGKTFVSAFVLARLLGAPSVKKRVLFLAHMTDLLTQASQEYLKVFPDVSVGFITGTKKSGVRERSAIVFSTFQSLRDAEGLLDPDDFDIVVVDESHHAQAGTFKDVIEYFRPKFLLGMTATPDRADADIREIFGQEVATITLAEAIAKRYVAPVKYRIMSFSSREETRALKEEIGRRKKRWTLADIESRLFQGQTDDLDERFFREAGKGRAITTVFTNSIEEAEHVADELRKRLSTRSAVPYHSDLPLKKREKILIAFKERKIRFLTVVDALNEGVDVPVMDRLIFLRATSTRRIFLQQLGRGLRFVEGKTAEVFDFVGNLDRVRVLKELFGEIQTFSGVAREKSKPFEVEGFDFTEVKDLLDILGEIEKNFYPTLTEASVAVQKLKILRLQEYSKRYREDLRLPAHPELIYFSEWIGWAEFLRGEKSTRKGFYPNLAEATAVVRKLKFQSRKEYKQYHEDLRLPRRPDLAYSSEWEGWPKFLWDGKRVRNPFYPTLAKAAAATRRLRIRSRKEYLALYRNDSRLPSDPSGTYAVAWSSWSMFLLGEEKEKKKFYPTLAKAAAATRRLRIRSRKEYLARYKENPRLPSEPSTTYAATWSSWSMFLRGEEERKKNFYSTLAKASLAARRLGIRQHAEYIKRYREDPHLPSEPNMTYRSVWISWPKFLGQKTK